MADVAVGMRVGFGVRRGVRWRRKKRREGRLGDKRGRRRVGSDFHTAISARPMKGRRGGRKRRMQRTAAIVGWEGRIRNAFRFSFRFKCALSASLLHELGTLPHAIATHGGGVGRYGKRLGRRSRRNGRRRLSRIAGHQSSPAKGRGRRGARGRRGGGGGRCGGRRTRCGTTRPRHSLLGKRTRQMRPASSDECIGLVGRWRRRSNA